MSGSLSADRLLVDLASAALGGRVIYANDEFFGAASRLLLPTAPEWREGEYTDEGKWMDGWETRRRRDPGFDYCILELGLRGAIRRVRVETTHFDGNQPEAFSLHGADTGSAKSSETLPPPDEWRELLAPTALDPDAVREVELPRAPAVTHVRFSIYPDGGVARLRLNGVARPPEAGSGDGGPYDLAALANGGLPIAVSDETFGEPQHLLYPEPSTHMGQGWETRRRRGPGHDWVVIRLGRRGSIDGVRLETHHFKGNYPESASLDWCDTGSTEDARMPEEEQWRPLLDRTPLESDATHQWIGELHERGPATHVRLNIFPDGGVSRLRIFGQPHEGP